METGVEVPTMKLVSTGYFSGNESRNVRWYALWVLGIPMLCIGPSEICWLPGRCVGGLEVLAVEVASLSKDEVIAIPPHDGSENVASEYPAVGNSWLEKMCSGALISEADRARVVRA